MPQTGAKRIYFYLLIYTRFGPEKHAFISYSCGENFYNPLSGFNQYLEIGSRFGQENGILAGVGISNGLFLHAKIPAGKQIIIEPLFVTGDLNDIFGFYNTSLILHYLLPDKNNTGK